MAPIKKVVVAGAGPAGLLLALLLAQHGITVEVVEAEEGVDQRPRGLAYGPSASRTLRRADVLDEIRDKTWDVRSMSWRNIDGEIVAGFENMDDQNPDRFLLYPVHLLCNLLLEHVREYPTAKVHMHHPVVGVGQDDSKAWVEVKVDNQIKRIEGDFVVGCDGASSAVRKALFGDRFPGHTWDKQIIGTNAYYDIGKYNWSDVQWIVDPENWGMICGINKEEGLWRIVYGEDDGFSHEELKARQAEKYRKLLPGHPEPKEYELVRFSPYTIHQRCVEKMRVGRVLLAGDAAHLCNPMGGLGLTSGIADVGSLVDCLYGIHDGKADTDILDKYDEIRRGIYRNIVDPLSSINLKRLWQDPESIRNTDPFFERMKLAATDPEIAKEMALMSISYDMTQHYRTVEAS